jgi:hypothetical protein
MANGALVLSEPVYLPEPFVPGKHYVEAPVEEMAGAAGRILADDAGRERMTRVAHGFVTEELTLRRSFADLLELIAQRVPPADHPLPRLRRARSAPRVNRS